MSAARQPQGARPLAGAAQGDARGARNLLLTGGIVHPFESSAPALADVLSRHGIESTVTTDIEAGLSDLARGNRYDLLTIHTLRWSMTQHEKYAPDRDRWALSLSAAARQAILSHVEEGGGLLGVHTASICFDDWPEWRRVLGGAWVWGTSGHLPPAPVEAHITHPEHPIVRGLPDFTLEDEVYGNLALEPGVVPLMNARVIGAAAAEWHPVLWERRVGLGRVVYGALGHDAASIAHPVHSRVLARAALWALRRPDAVLEDV